MKKVQQTLIYQDEQHQSKIKQELESSKRALQTLLNIWDGLQLTPCTDIHSLIMNSEKIYSEAIEKLAVVPVQSGRFQVSKQAFIQSLDVPVPQELYKAAKLAQQQPFAAVPELWLVEGNNVKLNESEAETYVNALNVYATDLDKIKLAQDLSHFCDLANSLNERLNGQLLSYYNPATIGLFREKFSLTEAPGPTWIIRLNPEYLKKVVQG